MRRFRSRQRDTSGWNINELEPAAFVRQNALIVWQAATADGDDRSADRLCAGFVNYDARDRG
ncbi:MAG TPA: hypothetical protein VF424_03735 [Vicinamibacterales bacterium]